jgi:hypothetical protein
MKLDLFTNIYQPIARTTNDLKQVEHIRLVFRRQVTDVWENLIAAIRAVPVPWIQLEKV